MPETAPRVSLGLPVFNGENYLEVALDSILAQTHRDFELVICDNASTDGTRSIGEAYARRDARVRYHRSSENLGAAGNFNRSFQLSQGEYFKWTAHDDLLAPDYLSRCVAVLDQDDSVVLCHSRIRFIDDRGEIVREHREPFDAIGSPRPRRRFADLVRLDHWCLWIFGLVRREALLRTPLIAPYIASDRPLLAELALLGRFAEIPEPLFLSRDHGDRSVRARPLHLRGSWFDTTRPKGRVLPHWRLWREYFAAVSRAPLRPRDRWACRLELLRWPARRLHWVWLGLDLVLAVLPGAWGPLDRLRASWRRRRLGEAAR